MVHPQQHCQALKMAAAVAGLQGTCKVVCMLLATRTLACGSTGLQANPAAVVACMQETWDIVCVLLMIRITHHHQLVMNKRRIPCLDDYFDRVNLMLWPRFKVPVLLGCLRHPHAMLALQIGLLLNCCALAALCLSACCSGQVGCC